MYFNVCDCIISYSNWAVNMELCSFPQSLKRQNEANYEAGFREGHCSQNSYKLQM